MSTIEERLTEIGQRLAKGEGQRPERDLTALIRQLDVPGLSDWDPEIRALIQQFQKQRKNRLSRCLSERTQDIHPGRPPSDRPVAKRSERLSALDPGLAAGFELALDRLRERHIFQWSTFYRDCLDEHLGRYLEAMRQRPLGHDDPSVSTLLADHTRAAFSQGYDFTRRQHDHDEAVRKSLNGLSRFLALPLDFYSVRAASPSVRGSASALRLLVSAVLSGIVVGYSRASLGPETGNLVLSRFPPSWMHYVAFFVPHHAEEVTRTLKDGPLADGLRASVLPLLDSLQRFHERPNDEYRPLPVDGNYRWDQRRLDITVRPPRNAAFQRLIEVNAFLDEDFVLTADLDDAERRQVTLVVAPLHPDVRKVASEQRGLAEIVVPAGRSRKDTANKAFAVWDKAVTALRAVWSSAAPITYNFAREFPLHDQDRHRATTFHVARTSVRDLLRTFERRPGVRLWCSVRRSGKTTACLDLDSTGGDSNIVAQTCGTARSPDDTRFFDRVREAVGHGRMISGSFVEDLVATCAPPSDGEDQRLVLVIDEYESLFGLLRTAAEREPGIRHTVVQPLLNQLMTFSYDNLLVFLGQQPDAHFILMDQNQLAPYVKQDPFPLFEHASHTKTGEFPELVRKILGNRIECDVRFLDKLFEETSGHPYLTANVLGEFTEWLIEQRRTLQDLVLRGSDFDTFAFRKLNPDRILLSPDYAFFRHAAEEAMSAQGYRDNPWLFTTYWVVRELSNGSSGRIRRAGFSELMREIPVPQGEPEPDGNEILRSASQANFLSFDDNWVRVRIRTLGRIAAAVRPRVA